MDKKHKKQKESDMIILIPMGGKGSRFTEAGYTINKACIPTTDRHTGQKLPMIICAMKDMVGVDNPNNTIICVDRDFHAENGTEDIIKQHFPQTKFIHDNVLLDQAYGCYLAKEHLNTKEPLFIGACDNGFNLEADTFKQATKEADIIMLSHTNNHYIERDPFAHSWAQLEEDNKTISKVSLKQPISQTPLKDHATTGMFWFKHAQDFLKLLERMIQNKDTLNGKYYVDKVLQYGIEEGLKTQICDVDYICWGTPADYEDYEQTNQYWETFIKKESLLK